MLQNLGLKVYSIGLMEQTDEEHNFIANHTVSLIVNSIQEMDTNTHSREFYWNLALGGLKNTTAYNNIVLEYSIYEVTGQDFSINGFEFTIDKDKFEEINIVINAEDNYGSQNIKGQKILEANGDCSN